MNLSAFLIGVLLSCVKAEFFYSQIILFPDGEQWRIQAQSEVSAACDSSCGASCLASPPVLLPLLECLEECHCQGAALPVLESTGDLGTCEGKCQEVCAMEDTHCMARCQRDFCISDAGSSVWVAVALDVVMLSVLLAMLYLAYLYTPKKPKRVQYWRKKISEAQYARLEDY
jgi:hypothetical protein